MNAEADAAAKPIRNRSIGYYINSREMRTTAIHGYLGVITDPWRGIVILEINKDNEAIQIHISQKEWKKIITEEA